MRKFRIAVYISGGGSNLKAILASIDRGYLDSQVVLVIANKEASGLLFAKEKGIHTSVINRKSFATSTQFAQKQLEALSEYSVDLIVLAGYLRKLHPSIVKNYSNKILNIHPALLPNHGGKGMYGINVHKSVLDRGEKYSGATVHFVNNHYDEGNILLQRSVLVSEDETPQTLQEKVLCVEHKLYSEAIRRLENGTLS